MLTLHFAIGQDNRAVLKSTEDMNITTETKGVKNWVQGRQYEDSMRQAMVYVTHGEDGTPFDLTDVNPWFEGVLPDGVHRILDAKHGVLIDPVGGQFRFDFPKQAFAVFGSYKQAFFRLEREGSSISTLEIDFSVLSDTVISGLIPSDYITPFEDLYAKLEDILANADGDLKSKLATWTTQFTDLMTKLSQQGTDTSNMLANVQTTLKNLETQIASNGLITVDEFDGKFAASAKTVTDTLKTVSGYVDTVKNSSWIYNNIKTLSAHRGAHIDAPENTAMAVAHAGMYGYGLIECDPRLTSDNQVVLMHDETVDRMTDGAGKVSDFTLDQLKQMTVDAAFSGKNDYNTIRVPTLAEVLHEVNQYGMGVNIDGSKLDWQDDNVINTVVGIIKQAGLMGRSFFVISDPAARKRLNALYPEAALSWLSYDSIDNYIAEAKTYTNAVISIDYGNLSRDYSAIASSGLPLHVYNVNSTSQYYDSVQHGARFVETDSLLPMTVTRA